MTREAWRAAAISETDCRACGRLIPATALRAVNSFPVAAGKVAIVPLCPLCGSHPNWEAMARASRKPTDVIDVSRSYAAMMAGRRKQAAQKKAPGRR